MPQLVKALIELTNTVSIMAVGAYEIEFREELVVEVLELNSRALHLEFGLQQVRALAQTAAPAQLKIEDLGRKGNLVRGNQFHRLQLGKAIRHQPLERVFGSRQHLLRLQQVRAGAR